MRKARMAATRQELRAQGPAATARATSDRSLLRRVVLWIVSGREGADGDVGAACQ